MKEPLISIIIPIYNVEKYLSRCIKSVLNQTYKNLEIICINDGSTDSSLKILEEFKLIDKRIKIINQKNTGQARARNNAFLSSKGEFICFVDSDDVVSRKYVESLYYAILKYDTSISVGMIQTFKDSDFNFDDSAVYDTSIEENIIKIFADKYIMKEMPDYIMQSVHTKLFKRYLLDNLDFNPIKTNILEDNIIMAQIISKVKDDRIAIVGGPIYYYRIHQGSTMQNALNRPIKYGDRFILYPELFKEVMTYVRNIFSNNPNTDKYIYQIESEEFFSLANSIVDKNIKLEQKDQQIQQKDQQIQQKDQQIQQIFNNYNNILNSKSYRIGRISTAPYRISKRLAIRIKTTIKAKRIAANRKRQSLDIDKVKKFLGDQPKKNNYAVVIHLFYCDMWDLKFKKHLENLYKISPFDLYINIPKSVKNKGTINKITECFPDTTIVRLPNLGRDVLPFVVIFKSIIGNNYDGVLKLHSKASTHTHGGSKWMDEVLNGLIPRTKNELESILGVLKSKNSLAGLRSVYISSSTYLESNKEKLNMLLTVPTENIKTNEMGFFAGTMFWISGSYKYLDSIDINKFEDETGQTDGTYAHAIERYVSMQPQINNEPLFKISKGHKVSEIKKSDIRVTESIDDREKFIEDEK